MWLTQPEFEPSVYVERWSRAKDLVALGNLLWWFTFLCMCMENRFRNRQWTMDIIFLANHVQVKETYNITVETNPPYIVSLPSPMRRKHRDDLLLTKTTVRVYTVDYTLVHSNLCIQPFSPSAFPPSFRRTSTTPGRRTSLLSTYFLARKPLWVRNTSSSIWNQNLPRIWEEHQNGPGGLYRLPWRTLRALSRLQHRLLCRNHLLGRCQGVSKNGAPEKVIVSCKITINNKRAIQPPFVF